MKPHDLVATARLLILSSRSRPSQVNLRRAVSTAYYAMFHCLARSSADLLVGGSGAARSDKAWSQVYRALEHNPSKAACKDRAVMQRFPRAIEDFANAYITMQEHRHRADYDPFAAFTKSEAVSYIDLAESAINAFSSESTSDRRAFCTFLLFKKRP